MTAQQHINDLSPEIAELLREARVALAATEAQTVQEAKVKFAEWSERARQTRDSLLAELGDIPEAVKAHVSLAAWDRDAEQPTLLCALIPGLAPINIRVSHDTGASRIDRLSSLQTGEMFPDWDAALVRSRLIFLGDNGAPDMRQHRKPCT